MKRIISILIISITCCISCQKDEHKLPIVDNGYVEMITYYNDIKGLVDEYVALNNDIYSTRAFASDDSYYNVEEIFIEPWFQACLDKYFTFDDISNWDERNTLSMILENIDLSSDQKEILITAVAHVYYIKKEIIPLFDLDARTTRATAKECRDAFDKAIARATRTFVIAGTIGLATGGVGTAVAAVFAYIAVDDAEKDYNKCMETATQR
ncbi:hypothetical protein [uncultured Alistipes sp.]|uniref:hypothetical protein n=1 Tax=uncultured Alistipes sp. TaxID=538949 RepID=UPI00263A2D65|nr:hypothetical protein [uncultured Alistipes sp.]